MLGAAAVKGHFGQLVLIQALLDIGAFMGVVSRRYLQRLINIASEWGEVMKGCSGDRERQDDGGSGASSSDSNAMAGMGVGRARERAGPGKWRRVVTLARWEPSARAHMLTHLKDATIDVTGD